MKLKESLKYALSVTIMIGLASCTPVEDTTADEDTDATPTTTTASTTSTTTTTATASTGTSSSDVEIPSIKSISLSGLGSGDGLSLSEDDEECSDAENVGLFGMALGGACHTAPLASSILLGDNPDTDGDGEITCADYGDDSGMLMPFLCEPIMLQNDDVTELAFEDDGDDGGYFGMRWDLGDADTVGSWSASDITGSMPAQFSAFGGDTLDGLNGFVSLRLTDLNNGVLHLNFGLLGESSNSGEDFPVRVQFSAKESATNCAATPSTDNCHWQDVKIYAGEGASTFGPPNGFHLRVISDGIEESDQTFLAIEGLYRYTEALAAAQFGSGGAPESFSGIRFVYFQVVQKDNHLWGKIKFQDANRELLDLGIGIGGGMDVGEWFNREDGICMDLANRDSDGEPESDSATSDKTCGSGAIDANDYLGLFLGEAAMHAPTSATDSTVAIPDVLSEAPTAVGIVKADGTTVTP